MEGVGGGGGWGGGGATPSLPPTSGVLQYALRLMLLCATLWVGWRDPAGHVGVPGVEFPALPAPHSCGVWGCPSRPPPALPVSPRRPHAVCCPRRVSDRKVSMLAHCCQYGDGYGPPCPGPGARRPGGGGWWGGCPNCYRKGDGGCSPRCETVAPPPPPFPARPPPITAGPLSPTSWATTKSTSPWLPSA